MLLFCVLLVMFFVFDSPLALLGMIFVGARLIVKFNRTTIEVIKFVFGHAKK
jgi:hypothetical protein